MDTVTTTTTTTTHIPLSRESDFEQNSAIKPSLLGSDEAHAMPKIEQPEARHPQDQVAIITTLTAKADEIITLDAHELSIPNGTTSDQGKENHPPTRLKKRKKNNKKKKRQPQTHQDQALILQLLPPLPPSPADQYPCQQDLCHAEPRSHQNGPLLPSSCSASPDNQEQPSGPFCMDGQAFSSPKSFTHILALDTLAESIKAPVDPLPLESFPDPTSPPSISPSSPTSMEPRQPFPRPRPPRRSQHIRRHSAPRLADGSTDPSLVYSDVLQDYITTDSYDEDEERERSKPSTTRTVSRARGRAGRIHKLRIQLEEQIRLLMEDDANAREESEKTYVEKIEALEHQDELRTEHYRCAVGAREKAAEVEQLQELFQRVQAAVAVGGAQNKDLTQANREMGKMNKEIETETLAEQEKIETLQRRYAVMEHGIAHKLKIEQEHQRLDDLMREETRRLKEEEANRLSEQEDARMKFEEELNYTRLDDDDPDPDIDSRYGHIQSNGSMMSLADEFEKAYAKDDFVERSTDSDLTIEHSTESPGATTEDGGTLPQWDSLDESTDTCPPPEQELQPARFLVPIQPLQKPPNQHVTIPGAPITTAIRDRHDYMQLVENTRRQNAPFWRMMTPNGFAIHYPGLLTQSCEPQQTPQPTRLRSIPPRCRGILGPLVSYLPYTILVLLLTSFALHPSSLDMVKSMFWYLRDDLIWNTRVDRSPTT
ncbi:MAG: hypothetical protein J3Q66DRAFT_416563 [Benniella sp.]|nr:MAG: hypothetical protein J3Q66DRAFT_416563 [Benniella sp.]